MVIESKRFPDFPSFHHHIRDTVRERPLFVRVELQECIPRFKRDVFGNPDDLQDSFLRQNVEDAFETNCLLVSDIHQQQRVQLVQNVIGHNQSALAGDLIPKL